jgi:putative spermidine/putrescine transport system permease protein
VNTLGMSPRAKWLLRIAMVIGLAFIYVPLIVVVLNSFNADRTFAWPPTGFTTMWWSKAWDNAGARSALWTSVKAGLGATLIALALGTMASMAVARYRFFGRETVSFLVILPIALPGIVTGMALNATFTETLHTNLTLFTVIVGHATFCIVVVFNNVIARLRRMPGSYEEAAMDLGAHSFRTYLDITFPLVRSALVAGGLLAFALSFDEIVVTTFTAGPGIQTLPVWIFSNMARPQQAPVVNVVAAVLVLLSVIPIYLAQRLSSDTASGSRI